MTFVAKSLDPNAGLLAAIAKKKPALYSDEDLKVSRELADYTFKKAYEKLGLVLQNGATWLNHNTLGAIYSGTTLTVNIDLASGVRGVYRGALINLPENSGALPDITVSAPGSGEITFGIWVVVTIEQLISSLKNNPNDKLYLPGVPTVVNDAVASIEDVTPLGNVLYEGFDFVKLSSAQLEMVADSGFTELDNGKYRFFRVATVTLDSNGTPNIYAHVDSGNITALRPYLANTVSPTVDDLVRASHTYLAEEIDSRINTLTNTFTGLLGNYALLGGRNNFTQRNTFARPEAINRNLTTNPVAILGGGTVGVVADFSSLTFVGGQAANNHFVFEANGTAAIMANSNWVRVKIPSNWVAQTSSSPINITKVCLSGNIDTAVKASITVIEIDFEHLPPNSDNKITVNGTDITSKNNYGSIPFITDRSGADKKMYVLGVFEDNNKFTVIQSNAYDTVTLGNLTTPTNLYSVSPPTLIQQGNNDVTFPASSTGYHPSSRVDSTGRVFLSGIIGFTPAFFANINSAPLNIIIGVITNPGHRPATSTVLGPFVRTFIVSSGMSSGPVTATVQIAVSANGAIAIAKHYASPIGSTSIVLEASRVQAINLDTISFIR